MDKTRSHSRIGGTERRICTKAALIVCSEWLPKEGSTDCWTTVPNWQLPMERPMWKYALASKTSDDGRHDDGAQQVAPNWQIHVVVVLFCARIKLPISLIKDICHSVVAFSLFSELGLSHYASSLVDRISRVAALTPLLLIFATAHSVADICHMRSRQMHSRCSTHHTCAFCYIYPRLPIATHICVQTYGNI